MLNRPRTLGLGNVVLDGFASNITNTPKEFSMTPEMPFSKVSSQPRMLLKNSISRISLKKLKCFSNTHYMRDFNKEMYMVRHYFKFINLKIISFSYFPQNFFAKYSKFFKFEWVFCIFSFPHKVKSILPNRMSEMCKFHFSSCAKFKNTAHAKTIGLDACADSGAHIFYYSQSLLRNGRFGLPSAKAQGILCM